MIKVVKLNSFDRAGQATSMDEIKHYIVENESFAVELIESERIIKLNIPFSELYRKCSETEWMELMQLIKTVIN